MGNASSKTTRRVRDKIQKELERDAEENNKISDDLFNTILVEESETKKTSPDIFELLKKNLNGYVYIKDGKTDGFFLVESLGGGICPKIILKSVHGGYRTSYNMYSAKDISEIRASSKTEVEKQQKFNVSFGKRS